MCAGHEDFIDHVVLDGGHAADSHAAAVLSLECVAAHTLDITHPGHRHDNILIGDQILVGQLIVKSDLCAALIAVFVADQDDLFADDAEQLVVITENRLVLGDPCEKFFVLVLDLLPLQSGQGAQAHLDDRVRLNIGKIKAFHEFGFRNLDIFRTADDLDDFIDVIEGDQQTFQDMTAVLRLL